ncbi:MAG: hypothetical protein AB1758_29185, partial [Candidatus Eremiobacterota bacterium]
MRFLERKRFRWPWSDPHLPLQGAEVAQRLPHGRVEVRAPDAQVPLPVKALDDLEELVVFHGARSVDPLGRPDLGQALRELAASGWRFVAPDLGEVGLYGAYNALTEGSMAVAATRGALQVPLEDRTPSNLLHFYRTDLRARLEEAGFSFFDSNGKLVSAYQGERVGHGEPWVAWSELPAGRQEEELERLGDLRSAAASGEQAAWAWRLRGQPLELFDLVADKASVDLALKVAQPGQRLAPEPLLERMPALLKKHGPAAGVSLFEHLKGRPEADLALRWSDGAPGRAARVVLFRELARTPPGDSSARSLQACARRV